MKGPSPARLPPARIVRGELAEPGEGLGHAEHVAGHRPHVPERGSRSAGSSRPASSERRADTMRATSSSASVGRLGPLDRTHVVESMVDVRRSSSPPSSGSRVVLTPPPPARTRRGSGPRRRRPARSSAGRAVADEGGTVHEGEGPRLEVGQPAQRRRGAGVRQVPWNMSSAARAGPRRSTSCTRAGPSPTWVNRSPQKRVPVVSSNTTCASQPWGTCGVGMREDPWPPMSSGSVSWRPRAAGRPGR